MGDPILRLQARVAETADTGLAKLLMEDTRAVRKPLLVLARNCPPGLTMGQQAVFAGTLELRVERDEARRVIVPVLTVQTVGTATAPSPWAQLDAVVSVAGTARTFVAPVRDADGMVLMQSCTGFAAGLLTREGTPAPLQVLYQVPPLPLAHYDQHEDAGITVMIGERPTLTRVGPGGARRAGRAAAGVAPRRVGARAWRSLPARTCAGR